MSFDNHPSFTARTLVLGAVFGLGTSYAGGLNLSYILMRYGAIFVMSSCALLILFSARLKHFINSRPNNGAAKIAFLFFRLWIALIALAGGVGMGGLFFYWMKLKGAI